jgi:HK97 family phage prohead protease
MDKELKKELDNNQYKFATNIVLNTSAINSENKTIEVILSDETPVCRYNWEIGEFDLILVHDNLALDLSRADIMPLLVQHNGSMLPIGIWENLRVEDRKLKGTAKFDTEDEYAMTIFGKFERGIMKSFSIGINSWTIELFKTRTDTTLPLYKATSWSISECSVVTIPANLNAKVGFSLEKKEKEDNSCYNNDELKNKKEENHNMTFEEFKAKHPELFAQVFESGKNAEKDRVLAHVEMAKSTGASEYAMECIEKGDGLTALAQAKYMSHGLNNQHKKDRQDENLSNIDANTQGVDVKEKDRDSKFAAYFNRPDLIKQKGE